VHRETAFPGQVVDGGIAVDPDLVEVLLDEPDPLSGAPLRTHPLRIVEDVPQSEDDPRPAPSQRRERGKEFAVKAFRDLVDQEEIRVVGVRAARSSVRRISTSREVSTRSVRGR
jgi:hypothetical protein